MFLLGSTAGLCTAATGGRRTSSCQHSLKLLPPPRWTPSPSAPGSNRRASTFPATASPATATPAIPPQLPPPQRLPPQLPPPSYCDPSYFQPGSCHLVAVPHRQAVGCVDVLCELAQLDKLAQAQLGALGALDRRGRGEQARAQEKKMKGMEATEQRRGWAECLRVRAPTCVEPHVGVDTHKRASAFLALSPSSTVCRGPSNDQVAQSTAAVSHTAQINYTGPAGRGPVTSHSSLGPGSQ